VRNNENKMLTKIVSRFRVSLQLSLDRDRVC